jgi:3-oxoadipate enol-lactonase
MPKIEVNGANVYYEVQGQGDPIIFITGFGCDHSIWINLLEKLNKDFTLLIFDNRGSGQTTDNNQDFTLEKLADDVAILMKCLDFPSAHIIGHSMGGSIAQQLAIQYPDRVKQLLLFNSSAKFNAISAQVLNCLIKLQKADVSMELLIDCFLPWGFSEEFIANQENIRAYKKQALEYSYPQTLKGNERQLHALNIFDSRNGLKKIKAPTKVFGSKNDLLVSEREIKFLADNIPNAELKMIAGSHLMLFEDVQQSSKMIIDFLK